MNRNALILIPVVLFFVSCSNSNKTKYGTNTADFSNKRNVRDNEFIQNGGYKVKIPNNPFINSSEVNNTYNSGTNSLQNIPQTPKELKK
ncbi:MAG: hypothetical protein ACI8ZF_000156 [Candidatus Midichloriaceae bacterium]|jgi:hypothetical protein